MSPNPVLETLQFYRSRRDEYGWCKVPVRVMDDACLAIETGAKAESRATAAEATVAALREALEKIELYGSDTLSGRADAPAGKDWYLDGVREMRNRARKALSTVEKEQ